MTIINIFFDGSATRYKEEGPTQFYGGAGTYIKSLEEGIDEELVSSSEDTTNNIMELTALKKGLERLVVLLKDHPHIHHVRIIGDSAYVINCFKDEWYVGWRNNGWKNSAGKPVANKELWVETLALYETIKYKFSLPIQFLRINSHIANSKGAKEDAREKFIKNNNAACSSEIFDFFVSGNEKADSLASYGGKNVVRSGE